MRNFQPKWLAKLLSHIAAFNCGAYVYAAIHGNPPEIYRVITTIFMGVMFYIMSLPNKN